MGLCLYMPPVHLPTLTTIFSITFNFTQVFLEINISLEQSILFLSGHGVPRCGENEEISERKLAWSNSGYFQDLPEKETTSNGI